jgi:hypothetical protein
MTAEFRLKSEHLRRSIGTNVNLIQRILTERMGGVRVFTTIDKGHYRSVAKRRTKTFHGTTLAV